MLVEAEFRMRVQISAPLGHIVVKCLDAIWNLHSEPPMLVGEYNACRCRSIGARTFDVENPEINDVE